MAHLTQQERNAIKSLLKGIPLERAKQWLINAQIRDGDDCGWPHLTSQDKPSIWGGTLDGINALYSAGLSLHDPIIKDSLEWLLKHQRSDGGFDSREITYSATESTGWVLIVCKKLGYNLKQDPNLEKAVIFLESCVKASGEVGTSLNDEPRIYPALITMWAIHGYTEKAKLIARYLKDSRDPVTGGWGSREGAKSNPGKTAQVLCALLQTGLLDPNDVITHQTVDYIINTQQIDGGWPNYFEEWYSHYQPHIPLRHSDHTISWAIRALVSAGVPVTSEPIAKAIDWLIRNQTTEGYWLFDPLDDSKHIWCVTGVILALAEARQKLLTTITETGISIWESERETENGLKAFKKKALSFIANNITNFAVVALALYIFRSQIDVLFSKVFEYFKLQSDGLATNIISDVIYAALIVLGTYLLNVLRRKSS